MTTQASDEMGRRSFLKAVALTAVAATTVGGGAGYLANKVREAPIATSGITPQAMPRSVTIAETAATANQEVADLLAQLASAQAENMRLRADLDAAERRLAASETTSDGVDETNKTLRAELASATQEVSILSGLVALYEQLDDGVLIETVEGTLSNFGQRLGGLLDELPTVEEGLAIGSSALDSFEERLPALSDGRRWLESHLARLNSFFESAEQVLESAAESAGTFLQMLESWFQGLRKWLPFGVGDRATQVMSTLTRLLDETPHTIHGLRRNVADPLDSWVGKGDEDIPLHTELLRPLREMTLQRAGSVVEHARSTGSAFETEVKSPLQETVALRRQLRQQIAIYREQNGL